ncbi:hypothetical protein ACFQ2H_30200 [Streptomyces violaceoruber]
MSATAVRPVVTDAKPPVRTRRRAGAASAWWPGWSASSSSCPSPGWR